MTLYEIDQRILDIVDPETGEITDLEALENLQMERDAKVEGVALWIKDLKAESEAIRNEEKALKERRDAADRKVESLKRWLNNALNGQRFTTGKCDVSFRRSTALNIEDDEKFILWAIRNERNDLLTYKDPAPAKKAITEEIKEGKSFPYCELTEKRNVSIK